MRRRVLLVDDEPLARRRLRQLLSGSPDFEVVGECGDVREVLGMVSELRPEVLFLDIGMPHADGFAVQASLGGTVPHVIFVTAHPEHALRAFDVAASDYLVKPVTQARFDEALARLRRGVRSGAPERVLLGGRLGGTTVPVDDILWLEADGSYVSVHLTARHHVVRESLRHIMNRLGATRFVRIHRSAAIHLAHVARLRHTPAGLVVELSNGRRLAVSRRKAGEVVVRLRRPGSLPAATRNDRS